MEADKCPNPIKPRKFFWNVLPDPPSHSSGSQSSRLSSPNATPTTPISVAQSVAPYVLRLQTLVLLLSAFSLL